MNILIIHQNFPGQFKHLAPALVQQGHTVVALTMQKIEAIEWQGVTLVSYAASRGSAPNIHPWVGDFETKTIRGEACFRAALRKLKGSGSFNFMTVQPTTAESMNNRGHPLVGPCQASKRIHGGASRRF